MEDTPQITYARFAEQQKTSFRILRGSAPAVFLQLVAVESHRPSVAPEKPGAEAFSLLFAGPGEPILAQATYTFEHEQLGRFAMFIVPIRRDKAHIIYEAVFNRSG